MISKAGQQLWHAVNRLKLAADMCRDAGDKTAAAECDELQRRAERLMLRPSKEKNQSA